MADTRLAKHPAPHPQILTLGTTSILRRLLPQVPRHLTPTPLWPPHACPSLIYVPGTGYGAGQQHWTYEAQDGRGRPSPWRTRAIVATQTPTRPTVAFMRI